MYNVEYNTHYAHYAHTNTEDWTSENLFLYYMNLNCHGGHYHHNHSTIINTHVCTGKKGYVGGEFAIYLSSSSSFFVHDSYIRFLHPNIFGYSGREKKTEVNKINVFHGYCFLLFICVLCCYVMLCIRIG